MWVLARQQSFGYSRSARYQDRVWLPQWLLVHMLWSECCVTVLFPPQMYPSFPGFTGGFWINIKPWDVTDGLVHPLLSVDTVCYSVLFSYYRISNYLFQSNRYFMLMLQWKIKKAHFGRVHVWWSNNWKHIVAKDPKALKNPQTFLSQWFFFFSTAYKPLTLHLSCVRV